jgi:hypothetical protein
MQRRRKPCRRDRHRGLLAGLDVWSDAERQHLLGFARVTIRNWRNVETGEIKSLV